MANAVFENLSLIAASLTKRDYKGPSTQASLSRALMEGTVNHDQFPGLNLLQDKVTPQEPSESRYLANGAFASILEAQKSRDTGPYVDIYDYQAAVKVQSRLEYEKKKNIPEFQQNVECSLTDNDLLNLVQVFVAWTGMDPEGLSPDESEYRDWTPEEMQNELNKVRAFLHNDLNRTLGLTGVLASINEAMFMSDLDRYSEDELMAYAVLFHLNLEPLEYVQEAMRNRYAVLRESGATPVELEEKQKENERTYIQDFKALILENKIWMVDRLRLWRWREEVFLGRVEEALEEYPGVQVVFEFETVAELLDVGIDNYFMRVGEVKREELIERYFYFDLYHMAGMLANGTERETTFTTNMLHDDLADLIITLLEELEVDPRHVLGPLGIHSIVNKEKTEVLANLYRKPRQINEEVLMLACSHAGLETVKSTEVESKDGTIFSERQTKPMYVLIEELASQYLSPQFYTGVEYHRYYLATLTSFTTASGESVTEGNDGDLLFYGVGDGFSRYRVYKPIELATVFDATRDFIDPYSRIKHPFNPLKWSRFSQSSIQRLLMIVLPQLRTKSKSARRQDADGNKEKSGRPDLDFLEKSIIEVFSILDGQTAIADDPQTAASRLEKKFGSELFQAQPIPALLEIEKAMHPKQTQERLISFLRDNLDAIREPLMGYFAYLWQLGVQFSDWETAMIRIDDASVKAGIESDDLWRHVDPETTSNLTSKIFNMLTVETEKYSNIIGTDGVDYTFYVKSLRFVRYYLGSYRIEWYDELATIEGLFHLMLQSNNLSYYHHLQTCGNWLLTTANYYMVAIADQSPLENEITIVGSPLHPGQNV
jgi:hypothetical protein